METSKGELVPGGLAMIIRPGKVAANLGALVVLERFAVKGEEILGGVLAHDAWIVTGNGLGYMKGSEIIKGEIAVCRPSSLMPINPEADPLYVEEEQCQTA